jgi:predicted DNA binding CopG/RHH family protein
VPKPVKKKIPAFKSDRAAAAFVDKLTQYDLSGARLTSFEIKPKDKRAARAGVPYQRFIRLALEQAMITPK